IPPARWIARTLVVSRLPSTKEQFRASAGRRTTRPPTGLFVTRLPTSVAECTTRIGCSTPYGATAAKGLAHLSVSLGTKRLLRSLPVSNLSSNSGVGKQFCHITMAAPTACSATRFLTIFILPPSAHHVWPKLFALRLRRKWQPACTARCRVWLLRITRKQSASSFGAPTRKQPISTWCPCSARRKRTALLSPS